MPFINVQNPLNLTPPRKTMFMFICYLSILSRLHTNVNLYCWYYIPVSLNLLLVRIISGIWSDYLEGMAWQFSSSNSQSICWRLIELERWTGDDLLKINWELELLTGNDRLKINTVRSNAWLVTIGWRSTEFVQTLDWWRSIEGQESWVSNAWLVTISWKSVASVYLPVTIG